MQPRLDDISGLEGCQAGVYLQPAYDPVRREVTYRQAGGKLIGGSAYELTAYAAIDPTLTGFRTFEGTPLATTTRADFVVIDDGGEPAPFDVISTADHYCAGPRPGARGVRDILGASGCGSCHGGAEPPEGLRLSTADGLVATAISKPAHGTQTGEHARVGDQTPSQFGRAMPIVAPLVPGNSYLLYKVLASADTPLEIPFPTDGNAVPPEVVRVRSTIISGMPMPPSTGAAAALREGEAEWLAEWIFQGAPVTCGEVK